MFLDTLFRYDAETDTYICPGNKRLKRKSFHATRQSIDYSASKKDCSSCELRSQCTKNKDGRTIKHHLQQTLINQMRDKSQSVKSKKDLRTRQHLMERSFARATRYGFDRARWRGLERVSIQEYLTCCVQNIQALIKPKLTYNLAVAMHATHDDHEVVSLQKAGIRDIMRFFHKSGMALLNDFILSKFARKNAECYGLVL